MATHSRVCRAMLRMIPLSSAVTTRLAETMVWERKSGRKRAARAPPAKPKTTIVVPRMKAGSTNVDIVEETVGAPVSFLKSLPCSAAAAATRRAPSARSTVDIP